MPTAVQQCIDIPDLLALCPQRSGKSVNRHLQCVDVDFTAWIAHCALFNKAQKKAWKDAKIPFLAAHALPYASEPQLRASTDLLFLTMLLDHLTATAPPAEAQTYVDTYTDLFRTHGSAVSGKDDLLSSTLRPLVASAFALLDPVYHARVAAAHTASARSHLLSSLPAQAAAREARTDAGANGLLALTQWTRGVLLPDDVAEHPALAALTRSAVDLLSLAHLPLVPNNGNSAAGLERFAMALRRFPAFGGDADLQVGRYVEGVIDWVVASAAWGTVSGYRYGRKCVR